MAENNSSIRTTSTHENNINIAEINEEEREAFASPAFDFYENESDIDEDIYALEDDLVTFSIFLKTLTLDAMKNIVSIS